MNKLNQFLAAASISVFAGTANATVIDFIDLTQNASTGLGESAWSTLSLSADGIGLDITGHATNDNTGDTQQYAYLDWGNAGLGVCKDAGTGIRSVDTAYKGSGTNLCDPSSDDNTTVGEYLDFMFDTDVIVQNFWFNNNHDGGFDLTDMVTIGGLDFSVATGYAGGINGIGSFAVAANTAIRVAYKNEEFYVSGMEFSAAPVSAPATLALMGLGLLGIAARRRA
ncbi:PEP-CTERM sorting domain-containing protein [Pseudomonadota bacterium]